MISNVTMENSKQLASRLKEVFLDGTWIANTNFNQELSKVDWQQATHKIGSLNTIAALTFHINYYLAGVLEVFKGQPLSIRDKYSFDVPLIESQEEWQSLFSDFKRHAEAFAEQVDMMSSDQLESVFVDEKYGTYRRNIEGMIEHGYYHLGQVVLIRKMMHEDSMTLEK